jgi:hypothetical protein
MCTVTFIPVGSNGYILTSSRDERTIRLSATPPFIEKTRAYDLVYPKDPHGGGTWIASDNRATSVCLLNGAFYQHVPQYPYRHSRGLVVLDFFKFGNLFDFIDFYDLNNIEPFTLVIIHDYRVFEFRWDGKQRTLRNPDFSEPGIWSSVTLYHDEIIKKRESWFQSWLKEKSSIALEDAIDFHVSAGEGNKKTDILMEQDRHLRTISITSINNEDNLTTMVYKDLLKGEDYMVKIGIGNDI